MKNKTNKKNKRFNNLVELTKQESGLIIKDNEVIVCNWSPFEGLPLFFELTNDIFGGIVDIELISKQKISKDEIIELLEDKKIIYDENNDLSADYDEIFSNNGGMMYKLKGDYLIICPKNWY